MAMTSGAAKLPKCPNSKSLSQTFLSALPHLRTEKITLILPDLLIREMLNLVPREPSREEILAGLPDEAKRLIEELRLVAIAIEGY